MTAKKSGAAGHEYAHGGQIVASWRMVKSQRLWLDTRDRILLDTPIHVEADSQSCGSGLHDGDGYRELLGRAL